MKPQRGLLIKWRMLLALGCLLPALINALLFYPGKLLWTIVTVVWLTVFFFFYLIYLPIKFKRLTYYVAKQKVVVHSGVFYNRIRTVPQASIQYVSAVVSPIDAIWGISSLVIVSPGSRIALRGLSKKDALVLAELLAGEG